MNELVDIKTAMKILNVKESWIRSKVYKEEIPFIKVGRLLRFRITDLEEYIEKNLNNQSAKEVK